MTPKEKINSVPTPLEILNRRGMTLEPEAKDMILRLSSPLLFLDLMEAHLKQTGRERPKVLTLPFMDSIVSEWEAEARKDLAAEFRALSPPRATTILVAPSDRTKLSDKIRRLLE